MRFCLVSQQQHTQYCIPTEWVLGRVECTQTLHSPQRSGRETISDKLSTQDNNRLEKDIMEVEETIGSNKTTDESRTVLQPNNITIELHETIDINKMIFFMPKTHLIVLAIYFLVNTRFSPDHYD